MELGKYYSVWFAWAFVLAAVVVTVVMGCTGIFLGLDFGWVFPKCSHLHGRTKAKLKQQTSVFCQSRPLLPVADLTDASSEVTLSWAVLHLWVPPGAAVDHIGQRCKYPSSLKIVNSKAKIKKLLLCLTPPNLTNDLAISIQWSCNYQPLVFLAGIT